MPVVGKNVLNNYNIFALPTIRNNKLLKLFAAVPRPQFLLFFRANRRDDFIARNSHSNFVKLCVFVLHTQVSARVIFFLSGEGQITQ